MASGVPIIAAQSPLTTEQFHDGQDALLYTAGDEDSLDAAIARLGETDRQLFYRRYYYLQPVAQIAAEMGMTERAAEGRLYRLRQRGTARQIVRP